MCDLRSHSTNNVFVLFICTLCSLSHIRTWLVHKEQRIYKEPSPEVILPKGKGIRQLKTYTYKKFEASWPIRINRRCMTMYSLFTSESSANDSLETQTSMYYRCLRRGVIRSPWLQLTGITTVTTDNQLSRFICYVETLLISSSYPVIFYLNAPLSDFGAYASSCIHGNNRPHSVVVTIFPLSCQRYYFSYTCSI